jgi:hypothetical protein
MVRIISVFFISFSVRECIGESYRGTVLLPEYAQSKRKRGCASGADLL